MNEWNAAAPIILDQTPQRRPHIIGRFRRLPRWQQASVFALIWAGVWTLLLSVLAHAVGDRPDGYVALFLACCAVVFLLITAIAWKTGRLS
jgi:hypothetical protein